MVYYGILWFIMCTMVYYGIFSLPQICSRLFGGVSCPYVLNICQLTAYIKRTQVDELEAAPGGLYHSRCADSETQPIHDWSFRGRLFHTGYMILQLAGIVKLPHTGVHNWKEAEWRETEKHNVIWEIATRGRQSIPAPQRNSKIEHITRPRNEQPRVAIT